MEKTLQNGKKFWYNPSLLNISLCKILLSSKKTYFTLSQYLNYRSKILPTKKQILNTNNVYKQFFSLVFVIFQKIHCSIIYYFFDTIQSGKLKSLIQGENLHSCLYAQPKHIIFCKLYWKMKKRTGVFTWLRWPLLIVVTRFSASEFLWYYMKRYWFHLNSILK